MTKRFFFSSFTVKNIYKNMFGKYFQNLFLPILKTYFKNDGPNRLGVLF